MILPARRSLLVFLLVLAALPAGAPRPARADEVRVEVDGVKGAPRQNVLTLLSLATPAEGGRSEMVIRRLHARAPQEIARALQPFGYYRSIVTSELVREKGGWVARYHVDPGPPLRVSGLDLQLTGEGKEDRALRRLVRSFPLAAGDTLDQRRYERGKADLAAAAADSGYLDAVFDSSQVRIDLDAYRANVILHLDTGPRFRFGEVRFHQGVLDSAVLRAYVPFHPGEPYRVGPLLELQSSLGSGPYFQRVEVRPRPDEAESLRVPIDVDLVPRPTQRYDAGVGYGSDTGARGRLGVEIRRLNRRGHRLEGELRLSGIERSVGGQYVIPSRYPSTDVVTFNAGYVNLAPGTSNSSRISAGATLHRLRGSWREDLSLTFQRDAFEVGVDDGIARLLVLGLGWSHTSADNRIYTRRGHDVRIDLSAAREAALSNASFLRAEAEGKLVRSLGRRTRILTRLDLGVVHTPDFRRLPPSDRFFAGGDRSVRGYRYLSLGPKDVNGDVIGGDVLGVGSVEVEHRFLRDWGMAAFLDGGNAVDGLSFGAEAGTGLGIRWLSPVGLVRLDGAFAVTEPGTPFRIHLLIGPDL